MNFEETKKNLQILIQKINNGGSTDTFEDIKDVELLESFITENIFNYCKENKYTLEGFPFVQQEKIENQEPGYDEDFMTNDRMDLYIHRLALEKQDVFELCFLVYVNLYEGVNEENVLDWLEGAISLMENAGITLEITEEELEFWNKVEKPYRPKLP